MVDFAIDVVVRGDKARQGVKSVERELTDLEKTANRTSQLISRALGGITAGLVIRGVGQLADDFTKLENQVKVANGGVGNTNKTLGELFNIANRSRAPIESITQLFQRLSFASGELGATQKDLFNFVETVSQSLAIQGGNASQASGALLQLSQAIGGGIVRAEEFNSILEGAFPIALAAAQGIDEAGGSVSRLRTLITQGKITSEEFFRGLLSQSDQISKSFGNTSVTVGQALIVLRNQLTRYIGETDKSLGISHGFAQALLGVAENLDLVAEAMSLTGVVVAVVFGPTIISAIAKSLTGLLIPALIAARDAYLVFRAALLLGGLSGVIPLIAGLASTLLGPLVVALTVAAGAAVFAQDLFVKFFNFLGLDGEKVLLAFVGIIEGSMAVAVGLFKGFTEAAKSSIVNTLKFFYQFDKTIKNSVGLKGLGPEAFGLTKEQAESEGLSVADSFMKGYEEGSKGWGFTEQLALDRGGYTPTESESPESVVAKTVNSIAEVSKEAEKAAKDSIKRQTDLLKDIKGPIFDYKQNMDDLNTLFSEGLITLDEYNSKLRDFQLEILELDESMEGGLARGIIKVQEEFSNLSTITEDAVVNAMNNAEDALVDFVTTGKLSVSDLVSSFLKDIARLQIRQNITGPFSNFLNDSLGSILGGLFGGTTGTLSNPVKNVSGQNVGTYQRFANGGSFMVGGSGGTDSRLVSFRASPNERVTVETPQQQKASAQSSVNVVYNIDARGAEIGVEQRIRAVLNEEHSSIIRDALSSVRDESQRNATYLSV